MRLVLISDLDIRPLRKDVQSFGCLSKVFLELVEYDGTIFPVIRRLSLRFWARWLTEQLICYTLFSEAGGGWKMSRDRQSMYGRKT